MTEELEEIYSEAEKTEELYGKFEEQVYKLASIAYSHPEMDVELDELNPTDMLYSSSERAESAMKDQIDAVKDARVDMKNQLYSLDEAIAEYQHQSGHLDHHQMDLPEEYQELRDEQNNLEELEGDLQRTLEDLSLQIYTQADDELEEEILKMNSGSVQRKTSI